MENNEKLVKKPTWKKIVSIVLNVLFYCFILFLFIFAISNIAGKDKHSLPNIFGYGYCSVPTDSMESEDKDAIMVGDMVFVKVVNDKEQLDSLKINEDIILFYDNDKEIFVIHRLVDILDNNGVKTYVTEGDKVAKLAPYVHGEANDHVEIVAANDVIAIYTGSKWDGFGTVLTFLQSKLGFGLCIVLPTLLLLILQGWILIKNLMEMNRLKLKTQLEAASQQTQEEKEAERERIRQELLAEMEQEKKNNSDDTDKK